MFDRAVLEQYYWISQVVVALIQFFVLCAAVWAGRAAYRQVETLRLYELLKFTQDDRFRLARRTVIREISEQQGKDWWADARLEAEASNCASNYDILGRMIEFGASKRVRRFFIKHWADSITRTYEILREFVEARRNSGGLQYDAYQTLYTEAKKEVVIGPNWPTLSADDSTRPVRRLTRKRRRANIARPIATKPD